MALLRERRSVRGWSTSTPDTLMADKANAGQAGPAVAAAGEGVRGLKRGWWRGFAVFLLCLLTFRLALREVSKNRRRQTGGWSDTRPRGLQLHVG